MAQNDAVLFHVIFIFKTVCGPEQHLSKPFSPHVKVLSSSEVRVTWLPIITNGGPFTGRYELYIGDEMEYVGHDLEYIAKRLKAGVEYSFKIRACGIELGTCSDFSFPRYATTDVQPRFGGRSGSAMTSTYLGKRRIFLVILTAVLGPVAVFALMISVYLFFRYMFYHLRHTPCQPLSEYDPELPLIATFGQEMSISRALRFNDSNDKIAYINHVRLQESKEKHPRIVTFKKSVTDPNSEKKQTKIGDEVIPESNALLSNEANYNGVKCPRNESEMNLVNHLNCTETDQQTFSSSDEDKDANYDECTQSASVQRQGSKAGCAKKDEELTNKTTRVKGKTARKQNKDKRGRSRTLSDSEKVVRVYPTEKTALERTEESSSKREADNIVVVIDNSNIFIGGRETACAEMPGLKQRHVKLRLHALVKALERKRPVSGAYAGGSSPPGNPLVWDVYRRLGYVVDLEDRRGKDEQRVDELLHLSIYKALVELPPQTLVIATGDGSKGKGSGDTSFPKCVEAALVQGWKVEIHSWKHCLSAEWQKIAAKYRTELKIYFLDEHLHDITYIEYRTRRMTSFHYDGGSSSINDVSGKQNDVAGIMPVGFADLKA